MKLTEAYRLAIPQIDMLTVDNLILSVFFFFPLRFSNPPSPTIIGVSMDPKFLDIFLMENES